MSDCVFCKIRDGQIPSMKIYEDERTLCIMDINPLNSGHCLVLTRAHAATIFDADPADLQAAITTAKRVATAQRAALQPDGLNMLQANGPEHVQDRKSTRLNSSHGSISYAVFCLKKKSRADD